MVLKKMVYNIKGMPTSHLKKKWKILVLVFRMYITCEGRYGLVFYYHFWILMVFIGYPLNFPYYLLNSLSEMDKFYQKGFGNHDRRLFHHGLIRILVELKLSQLDETWEKFLQRKNFNASVQEKIEKEFPFVDIGS
jgi:hypothetical protein